MSTAIWTLLASICVLCLWALYAVLVVVFGTEKVRHWPYWMRSWVASVLGYFWLPCPVCGCMFAGYEWESGNSVYLDPAEPFKGTAVCSAECAGPQDPSLPPGWRVIGWTDTGWRP